MKDKNKVLILKMFFGTVAFAIFIFGLIILAVPKDYSFTIKMDDNTLKAVQSLNQTLDCPTPTKVNNEVFYQWKDSRNFSICGENRTYVQVPCEGACKNGLCTLQQCFKCEKSV